MLKRALTAAALALAALSSNAQTVLLSEGFDDVSSLAGKGWDSKLVSFDPSGQETWFQGSFGPFTAQSGGDTSYIASNFSIVDGGAFANYLVTPEFSTAVGGTVSFFARSAGDAGYQDLLGFGMVATLGNIVVPLDLGLLSIHQIAGDWTQYTWNYAARGAGTMARFAFEYVGSYTKSDYIGIDSLTVTAVPEPSTYALLAAGLLAVGYQARRRAAAKR